MTKVTRVCHSDYLEGEIFCCFYFGNSNKNQALKEKKNRKVDY